MKLTDEQKAIINSKGDIKINAVAGSGKTTTLIEYAKSRPANSKILYIAFNRSVKTEAIEKFSREGLHNVKVETAHSLAFKNVVMGSKYKMKPNGYKIYEIVDLLEIKSFSEKHDEFITASHVNRFLTYYCNSKGENIKELDYLSTVSGDNAKKFVNNFYKYIEKKTQEFFNKMDKSEIEVTHDFYLKKFQLSEPELNYDYILFDEGQDASPAMLDVFMKQNSVKVIVGDTHQQIYGWRFAINSLEKTKFKNYNLTNSFRFNQNIADLGVDILNWKKKLRNFKAPLIKGTGKTKKMQSKAVLARTNLGLLTKVIDYVTKKDDLDNIYFEGNINSYTYADEGASLYDVLNLYNGKKNKIRDKLIKRMGGVYDLEDYIKKTDDMQLRMMLDIVKNYGNGIYHILNQIKEKHIEGDDKEKAKIIFSTVHKCKGMEYDAVQIVDDFTTEEKIKNAISKDKIDSNEISKLNEEINLLYVAVTRAKNKVFIPDSLLPDNIRNNRNIKVLSTDAAKESNYKYSKRKVSSNVSKSNSQKAYSVEKIRKKRKSAYRVWTFELDSELTLMYLDGKEIPALAKHFERTEGAIKSRLKKLRLL